MNSIVLYVVLTFGLPAIILIVVYLLRRSIIEYIANAIKFKYEADLKRLEDELRRKSDSELAKLNANLDKEVEIIKIKSNLYSRKQFALYNELWASLCDLRYAVDALWERATENNLLRLAKQLRDTAIMIEKAALLIEIDHYNELKMILDQFMEYHIGKQTLIDLHLGRLEGGVDHESISTLTLRNQDIKERLSRILPEMMVCLRSQISGR